jgi:tetratricopeptide (TPR) repeat protein
MPELIRDGENGFLLPRTALAFQKALSVLRDDARLRARMGKEARASIERDWNWTSRTDAFARMFDAALAAPKGATAAATAMERGVHAIAHGDADAAIAAMQDALAADPRCSRAHAHLAQLWWDKGTHDAALTALGHQRDALQLGRDAVDGERGVEVGLRDAAARGARADARRHGDGRGQHHRSLCRRGQPL